MKLLIRLDITVRRACMAGIAGITVQAGVIAKAVKKWEDFSEEEQAIYREMNIEMESRLYDGTASRSRSRPYRSLGTERPMVLNYSGTGGSKIE